MSDTTKTPDGIADRIDDFAARDRFKISIPGICRNCTYSQIYRTGAMNDAIVLCGYGNEKRVPVNVIECNKFSQLGELSIWQLTQLCLDIDISKPDKNVGFRKEEK